MGSRLLLECSGCFPLSPSTLPLLSQPRPAPADSELEGVRPGIRLGGSPLSIPQYHVRGDEVWVLRDVLRGREGGDEDAVGEEASQVKLGPVKCPAAV